MAGFNNKISNREDYQIYTHLLHFIDILIIMRKQIFDLYKCLFLD